jgi:ABC-type transporter Mla subunit MlaD
MNKHRALELKVGIVAVTGILIFIIAITLAKNYNVGGHEQKITLRFPNSGGIQPTAPVFVNGVKRGSVESVRNDNGSVLITAYIDNINDFRKDITAQIAILEITGGKKIEISPGASSESFNPNVEIAGRTAPDIGDLINIAGSLSGDVSMLLQKLDTTLTSANNLLSDKAMIAQIKNTVENASSITNNLEAVISQNAGKINAIIANLETLSKELKNTYSKLEPGITSIVNTAEETMPQVKTTLAQANEAIADARKLLGELNAMVTKFDGSESLAWRLLYDKKFAGRVDSTLNSLEALVKQISKYGINANVRFGSNP